jgi:hypothetical protein
MRYLVIIIYCFSKVGDISTIFNNQIKCMQMGLKSSIKGLLIFKLHNFLS